MTRIIKQNRISIGAEWSYSQERYTTSEITFGRRGKLWASGTLYFIF
jgi:hypothetical protein